jgi:hypothetical protein
MKTESNKSEMELKIDQLHAVERWTIDRLDRDAGVARLEKVQMIKRYIQEFISLINNADETTAEKLEWWDSKKAIATFIPIAELMDILKLKDDETLNENMVFWILKGDFGQKIIHATNQARNLAGELYRKVLGIEDGRNKNDK